jgi:hypothetical protein
MISIGPAPSRVKVGVPVKLSVVATRLMVGAARVIVVTADRSNVVTLRCRSSRR